MIKTYEGFIINSLYKMFPHYKLAQAFVIFFNNNDKKLKCDYRTNKQGFICIESGDYGLVYIDKIKNSSRQENIEITLFNSGDLLSESIYNFILYIFNADDMVFNMNSKDIPLVIEKLTIDNYNSYLIIKDSEKYNL